jgi:WD40 repeat protein
VSAALLVAGLAGIGPPALRAQSTGIVPKPRLDLYGDPLPDGAISRFGTVRFRNLGDSPIAVSPDGRHFATDRNGLSLMDRATGELVRGFATNGATRRISFSPDGKQLLTHNDGDAAESIWDVGTGKKLQSIERGGGVFVRDGRTLIQVERIDNSTTDIRLVGADGKKLSDFRFRRRQHSWAASPTGNHVAFDYENRLVLVDLALREELDFGDVSSVVGDFRGCVFSPDGKRLIVAGGTAVAIWDVETGKEVRVWKGARADSPPVVSPDGKRVAWSGYDNELGIAYPWAVDVNGDKPWRVGAATNSFTAPAFSHDGKQLAIFDDGRAMQFRDPVTGKEVRPVAAHGGVVGGIKFTADGKHLITSDKNRVLVWDRATTRLLRRYPDDLPDGERLLNTITKTRGHIITLDRADVLRLRELVTGKAALQLEGKHGFIGGGANPASISVDGGSAAVVDKDGDIRVYDLKSGKVRFTLDPEAAVWSADLAADGRFLQVSTQGRKLSDRFIVDTKTGKEVAPDSLHPPETKHLGAPSEGRLHPVGFETMNWLAGQRLLDAAGKPLELDGAFAGAHIYSPANGRYIAIHTFRGRKIADDDEPSVRVRIWDAETKKLLTHFNPQKILPEGAVFSPNGRTMVLVGRGVISAWEVATGRERARFKGHFNSVTTVCFTPDGRGLVSGGDDSQVLLWDYTGRCRDGVWTTVKHTGEQQRALWTCLAGGDAAEAHRAIWELIADPEGTTKFLDGELQPAKMPAAAMLAQCIGRLSSPAFAEREKATTELRAFGDVILPHLRAERRRTPDAEPRERLERIIAELEQPATASSHLQRVRAVEVLDAINTTESRRVLEKLARGEASASLTREAKFGLGN